MTNRIYKKKFICPVCRKHAFKENYEICPVCGWENDPVQRRDVNFAGGANHMSVKIARREYKKGNKIS